jgi:hypothetical protein
VRTTGGEAGSLAPSVGRFRFELIDVGTQATCTHGWHAEFHTRQAARLRLSGGHQTFQSIAELLEARPERGLLDCNDCSGD